MPRRCIAALLAGLATASALPAAEASGEPVAALARLELIDHGQGAEAWAENLLSGPVEVVLRARGTAPRAQPSLPARATVPARSRVLLSRLEHGRAPLLLEVVPGHPGARPRDLEYAWPLGTRELRVTQGWGGGFSHADDENRHAVDFAVPEGTPVLAARDGLVMQVEARFSGGGTQASEADRANFIRVLHDDGTMALYAHLAPGGAQVRAGERVRRGQRIGTSGNTGRSGGPHLHFVVQANRGLRLASIPFRMFGPGGILRFSEAPSQEAAEAPRP